MIFRRLWQSCLTQNDLLSRERFKFWSDMKRKPGETIPELASRIRQDAATCDFQSIKDPLHDHAKSKTSKTQEKKTACFRCGNSGHFSKACPHIKAICSFCKKTGHLQSVCMSRLRDNSKLVKLVQTIRLNDRRIKFEIDSGASDKFCCEATWQTLGKPTLQPVTVQYQVAEGSPLPVVGQFQSTASIDGKSPDVTFPVIVTKVPNLNLLGRLG